MNKVKDEDDLLQSVALQNAAAILRARHQAEQKLRSARDALHASNDRITSILESITDGFIVLDDEWRITYVNGKAEEIFAPLHKSRADLIGRNVWDAFPDLKNSELERTYQRARDKGVSEELEAYYPPLSSWFVIRAYPSLGGISVYFRDVTRRKEAEGLLACERKVLEMIAKGEGQRATLEVLAREIEHLSVSGMRMSVLVGDPGGDLDGDSRAGGSASPIFSSRGEILGAIAVICATQGKPDANDQSLIVTATRLASIVIERARAEEAIRERDDRLTAMFEQAAVGIAVAGLDGRFQSMNQRFLDIIGYPRDEAMGITFFDITHPGDMDVTRGHVKRLLAGETDQYAQEKRYIRKDGSQVWSMTSVTLVRDASGEAARYIGVIEDITRRKQAEHDLQMSEQFSRSIIESSLDCIKTLGIGGDVLWMNDRGLAALGIADARTIVGKSYIDMWSDEYRPEVESAVGAAAAGGIGKFLGAFPAQGTLRWWNVVISPIRGASGDPETLLAVSRDVTEQIVAERQLQEETRVLELLNRTGTTLTSNLELEALVQSITDSATELSAARFGAFFYNTTDAGGDAFMLYTLSGAPREAFAKFDHPRATDLFAPTFRGEGIIRCDDVLADPRYGKWSPHHGMPEGHLPVRSYLAVPVIARSGEVIGGLFFGHPEVGVFDERTERLISAVAAQAAVAIDNARLYQAAQKAAKDRESLLESERSARSDAERASRMKDEFLATLSHELRTPLSSILGWAHVLRTGRATEEDTRTGLEAIERNARAQTQLIEDLLDMSRIVSGKVRLDIEPVPPVSFIEAAIETVLPAANAKSVRIEKFIDPGPFSVSGDAGRLQQVIWNLLSNAIKFTPKDGKVQVVLEQVDSQVQISVADTGIGINPAFLDHVFERFRQADASTTRHFGGLGLGLSIVRHLVELHGGSVSAMSAGEGLGSTFVVRLPLATVHRHAGLRREHPRSAGTTALDYKLADLTGVRVLVVDDQPDARELVSRVISECNAEVRDCGSGQEALALIESFRPSLLLTDIGMPGMDGFELLRRVRALGKERGGMVPAIALTAFARSEDRTRALRAGFVVHVAKPVEPAELVATVASVAGRFGDS